MNLAWYVPNNNPISLGTSFARYFESNIRKFASYKMTSQFRVYVATHKFDEIFVTRDYSKINLIKITFSININFLQIFNKINNFDATLPSYSDLCSKLA